MTSKQADEFSRCIDDLFLHQCVIEPTFQSAKGDQKNILDLILTDNANKVYGIHHHPQLGPTEQGHHILTWNYIISQEPKKP